MLLIQLLLCSGTALAASGADWRGRSIYQVFTDRFSRTDGSTTSPCNLDDRVYCGGTWRGVIDQLDYIQDLGFTAVWISPITSQIQGKTPYGEAYHAYWQDDIYSLNDGFGSTDDLKALSTALHKRDMYLMVDVVTNHYAWNGAPESVDYATYVPFNSSDYFHPYCAITNWDDQQSVEKCWLGDTKVPLTDLDTENPEVQSIFDIWIRDLVQTYSIDGLRIDTVKHVPKSFWASFTAAAGVYSAGEVFHGDMDYVCDYQNYMDGLLNYPIFYPLTEAFKSTTGNMFALHDAINRVKDSCRDSTMLAGFLENHDIARFPSYTQDVSLIHNALAFPFLTDGPPILYQGQEYLFAGKEDPVNREALWLAPNAFNASATSTQDLIAAINQIRNYAIFKNPNYLTYKAWPIWVDASTLVVRKGFNGGQIVSVFSNLGQDGASYEFTLPSTSGFEAGQAVHEILRCDTYITGSDAQVRINMGGGELKVFYPTGNLVGSGICGL